MAYETILLERRGPVAFIRFNRPDKLNAMSTKMKDEVLAALEKLEADDGVRVVVFTGQGDKAFVAGADLHAFKAGTAVGRWDVYHPPALYDGGRRFSQPRS